MIWILNCMLSLCMLKGRKGRSGKWRQKGRNQSYHQDPKTWSWRQNLEAGWWIWSSSRIPCQKAGFLLEVVSLALSHVSVNIEWKNIVTGATEVHAWQFTLALRKILLLDTLEHLWARLQSTVWKEIQGEVFLSGREGSGSCTLSSNVQQNEIKKKCKCKEFWTVLWILLLGRRLN